MIDAKAAIVNILADIGLSTMHKGIWEVFTYNMYQNIM